MRGMQELNEIIQKSPYKKKALAEMLGITPQNFCEKCKGKRTFKFDEVMTLAEVLKIPNKNLKKIFLP